MLGIRTRAGQLFAPILDHQSQIGIAVDLLQRGQACFESLRPTSLPRWHDLPALRLDPRNCPHGNIPRQSQ